MKQFEGPGNFVNNGFDWLLRQARWLKAGLGTVRDQKVEKFQFDLDDYFHVVFADLEVALMTNRRGQFGRTV